MKTKRNLCNNLRREYHLNPVTNQTYQTDKTINENAQKLIANIKSHQRDTQSKRALINGIIKSN